ncbi:flavodoxin family protein [Clostridium sp. Marseille-Q7071]
MKVIAINGSPRKNANTATLLKKALEGASSQGAETELINLYDFNYKGCISCFACKRIGGKSYGKCAINDDLTPIFEKIVEADALIFGSPIYFGDITGAIRSFMERLMFPYTVYEENYPSLFKKKISTGFIYTMNISDDYVDEAGYKHNFKITENFMRNIFGASESLLVTDTYQFDDYSKYVSTVWNEEKKAKRREEEFPNDCKKAFEMGVRFAQ